MDDFLEARTYPHFYQPSHDGWRWCQREVARLYHEYQTREQADLRRTLRKMFG